MSRSTNQRIADIIHCCEKILRFTSGINREQFAQQELVIDAVLRNIEIIGEATKRLPEDVRNRMPNIEWKKIAGMRDWLAHVDFQVDEEIVWDAVETKIPNLPRTLQLLEDESQP